MEIQFIQKAGEYRLLRYIEKGLQGKVYLAKDSTQNKLCAVKISNLLDVDQFRRQKQFLSTLQHPNIVKYINAHENVQVKIYGQPVRTNNIMILELAQRGQIYQFIKVKRFTEQIARYYIKQVLAGLKYLHQNNITHRDLKLENILVTKDYQLKITDFGFAKRKQTKQTKFSTQLGTQGYQAPQILKNPPRLYDGQKSDMFAIGVLLFIFVKGLPPFSQAKVTDQAYKMIIDKKFDKFWKAHQKKLGSGFFSQQFKNLINKFLSFQPNQRPTFEQLQKDPWLFKQPPNKPPQIKELEVPWHLKQTSNKSAHIKQLEQQMNQRYQIILQNNQNKKDLQKQFDKFYQNNSNMIDQKDQPNSDRGVQFDQKLKQFKLHCKIYTQKLNNIESQNYQKIILFLVWLRDYLKHAQKNEEIFTQKNLYNIKPSSYDLDVQIKQQFILASLEFKFQTFFQDQQTQDQNEDDIEKTIEVIRVNLQIPTKQFNFKNWQFSQKEQNQEVEASLGKQIWKNQIKKSIASAIFCFVQKM